MHGGYASSWELDGLSEMSKPKERHISWHWLWFKTGWLSGIDAEPVATGATLNIKVIKR